VQVAAIAGPVKAGDASGLRLDARGEALGNAFQRLIIAQPLNSIVANDK
jgi:hypothetical protein